MVSRVPLTVLKLTEARRRVVHVVPSQKSCEDKFKDGQIDVMGCIESSYHCFIVSYVLDPMGSLVFCLSL
jgi:hypothetical protein